MSNSKKKNHTRVKRIERRKRRRGGLRNQIVDDEGHKELESITEKRNLEPLRAITEAQAHYIMSIESNDLTFATGPAGTGKTYIVGSMAAKALDEGAIDRIVITRPGVEAGESFGFLPGELEEKFEPYIQPFRDVLEERLGKGYVKYLIKIGRIKAEPLAFMRGKTYKNCWVILDEGQNTTPTQMKLFLTRMGENCKMIVDGDVRQKDIHGVSGLSDAVRRLRKVDSVASVGFTAEDIVRHSLVQDIINAYDAE